MIGTRSVVPRRVRSTGVVTSARRVPLWSTTWATSEIGASGGDLAGVERDVEPELAARLGRLGAQHPEPRDPHRTRVAHPDRPPDPARVPVGIEVVPVPEDAGDRALRGPVGLARARDLDREDVRLVAGVARDLERVGEEVALGRAEVVAVAPHVAEVEDAVERQEPAVARRRAAAGSIVRRYSTGPSVSANSGAWRQWPGTSTSGQSSSPKSASTNRRARSPSSTWARHRPDRSTGDGFGGSTIVFGHYRPPPAGASARDDTPAVRRWLRRRSTDRAARVRKIHAVEQHELDHPQHARRSRRWRSAGSPRAS